MLDQNNYYQNSSDSKYISYISTLKENEEKKPLNSNYTTKRRTNTTGENKLEKDNCICER